MKLPIWNEQKRLDQLIMVSSVLYYWSYITSCYILHCGCTIFFDTSWVVVDSTSYVVISLTQFNINILYASSYVVVSLTQVDINILYASDCLV